MRKLLLVLKNISNLFKTQTLFVLFFLITQIAACLSVFLSIGAIHNTRSEQKVIDIRSMFFEVHIEPIELKEMQKKGERILSVIPDELISTASISGKLEDDSKSYYLQLNASSYSVISPEQLSNGEKVVGVREDLIPDEKSIKTGEKIEFCGTEYTVISVGDYVADYIFPVTAVDSALPVYRFRIELNDIPSRELAEEIEHTMHELFPITTDSYSPEIPDLVSVQFNRTMIITSLIVIAVVVLNLSYCYCYLFILRRKMLSIYMICGGSKKSTTNMMITESVIISAICYFISAVILIPFVHKLSEIYPASESLYTALFFILVGLIYILLTVAVIKIMFFTILKKSVVDLKRGV